jgi:hypothetical protein
MQRRWRRALRHIRASTVRLLRDCTVRNRVACCLRAITRGLRASACRSRAVICTFAGAAYAAARSLLFAFRAAVVHSFLGVRCSLCASLLFSCYGIACYALGALYLYRALQTLRAAMMPFCTVVMPSSLYR